MPTEKEIRAEVALQKRKTKRIRELATKGWDKDGNPIWSAGPRKAVVIPPDGTLNEKAVKRYTYSSARPNKPSKPIFWSTDDIGRILEEEKYGSGVRRTNIPKIVLDENYVLAVKGQTPIKARIIPSKANKVSTIKEPRVEGGKWTYSIYDKDGRRWYRTASAEASSRDEVRKEAEKAIKEGNFKPKQGQHKHRLILLIKQVLKEGRINEEQASKLLAKKTPGDMRRAIKHFTEVVNDELVLKPLKSIWSVKFPVDKKTMDAVQRRVGDKLRRAKSLDPETLEGLKGELNKVSGLKNIGELEAWEGEFNSKYKSAVGWKEVAHSHINKSNESWLRERIRKHAVRHFDRTVSKGEARRLAIEFVDGLSDAAMVDWNNVLLPIKKYNDKVYSHALETGDNSVLRRLLEVHHKQPMHYGGSGLSPFNIVGAEAGGAGTEHRNVHQRRYTPIYEDAQRLGVGAGEYVPSGTGGITLKTSDPSGGILSADEWVFGAGEGTNYPEPKINIMNLRNNPAADMSQNIWNYVKPFAKNVGKYALRAVPLAGTALSAKAADDYRRAGQHKLATMAALSAAPGPWGWAGLAGELGGLLYNKVTEDPNFLGRGILSDGSQTTPVIRQRRGHF